MAPTPSIPLQISTNLYTASMFRNWLTHKWLKYNFFSENNSDIKYMKKTNFEIFICNQIE